MSRGAVIAGWLPRFRSLRKRGFGWLLFGWLLFPWAESGADSDFQADSAAYVQAGRMSVVRARGCGTTSAVGNYVGAGARFEAATEPTEGSMANRAAVGASVEARAGQLDATSAAAVGTSASAFTAGIIAAHVGWDSSYLGIRVGGWGGPVYTNESWVGFGSLALRVGPRDRYLRLSLFDQPGCYLTDCALGAEVGWKLTGAGPTRLGASIGLIGGYRFFLLNPIEVDPRVPLLLVGGGAGVTDRREFTFSLTLGITARGSPPKPKRPERTPSPEPHAPAPPLPEDPGDRAVPL
jgi:hypothetical protein